MDRLITTSSQKRSLINTHKVLRNTYFLLSLTIAFSSLTATISTMLRLPAPNLIVMLVGFYGLLFLTYRLSNSLSGIFSVFALTGFIGYTLGPLFNILLSVGAGDIVVLALSSTAIVFLCCSAYVLNTQRDMSFLSGMMLAGFVTIMIMIIANIFWNFSPLSLAISTLFVLFSAGAILIETSDIIYGGETNYIRATVSLYVSLYNMFVSFLHIFGRFRNN